MEHLRRRIEFFSQLLPSLSLCHQHLELISSNTFSCVVFFAFRPSFQELTNRLAAKFQTNRTAEIRWDEDEELILKPNESYKKRFRLSDPEGHIVPLDQGLA